MLFDLCVDLILQSPSLLGKAAAYLPITLSRNLLLKAYERGNCLAVEKFVEAWPHRTLAIPAQGSSGSGCPEPHQYSKAFIIGTTSVCALSIAVGLFYKLFHLPDERFLLLSEVDLTGIQLSDDEGQTLLL